MFLEVILKCRPCTHRHLNLEVLLEVLLVELEEVLGQLRLDVTHDFTLGCCCERVASFRQDLSVVLDLFYVVAADQQTGKPPDLQTSRPTDQQANRPADQQTSNPADQHTSRLVDRQTSKPADQQSSRPAN